MWLSRQQLEHSANEWFVSCAFTASATITGMIAVSAYIKGPHVSEMLSWISLNFWPFLVAHFVPPMLRGTSVIVGALRANSKESLEPDLTALSSESKPQV